MRLNPQAVMAATDTDADRQLSALRWHTAGREANPPAGERRSYRANSEAHTQDHWCAVTRKFVQVHVKHRRPRS
jgi:hypothetical protein